MTTGMKLHRNFLRDWEENIELAWRDTWGDAPPARLKPLQRKIVMALKDIQRTVQSEAKKSRKEADEAQAELAAARAVLDGALVIGCSEANESEVVWLSVGRDKWLAWQGRAT